MIQLQTLGDAVIKIGDREVRPTSPAVFAVLLYLGVERGQKVARSSLQELLFPETDERSGAHSLRQLLYKLRQLGASVQAEGDVVWLAPEDVVDDYSAPARTNGNGSGHGPRGAFLAGYVPKLSVAFDEWLESRRATIGVSTRRALIKQMLARRDAADWISVERLAQDVLSSDPFNQEATLALAESTALAGSKSEAIRILERYESETGNADLKLPASILRKRISERLPDRRRRALDTPFVGRDSEAEAMRQAIVRLRAGIGGTVVISGEPGIGKTRLVEETSALALLEGVNVHVVRCQPHYTSRPMGVFIEWVPMLMQSRGALGVAPETMEHLKLLTSHSDDRANLPTDARDDATRSGILTAALRDLVDAVASEAPIFLAVEDAHWADRTSLGELCSLLERRKGRLLMIVFTTRVLDPLKEVGALAGSNESLRLKPLVETSMLDLSQHLLSVAQTPERRDGMDEWCAKTAAGNPLYLQMLCGHYEDTQEAFSVPPSIRVATVRRLEQLPPGARRLLEYCALLGRHATLGTLKTLLQLPPISFLNTVQSLEEGGYLRTDGASAQLCHDLLRECTLELVPPLSRKLLHGSVADHLEKEHAASQDSSLLWDCADHWAASGELGNAIRFVLRCAAHAANMGQAPRALELLQRSKPFAVSPGLLHDLLDEISRLARAARNWQLVLDVDSEQRMNSASFPRSGHTDAELRILEAEWALSLVPNEAPRLLLCASSSEATATHRVDAALLAVRIAHEIGNADFAHEAYSAVKHLLEPRRVGSNDGLLHLIYQTSFGDRGLALAAARSLRDALPTQGLSSHIRESRNIGTAFCFLGHPEEGLALHVSDFELASRLGLTQWQFEMASSCCIALANTEQFEAAESWYQTAESLRNDGAGSSVVISHAISGVEIAVERRDRETAIARLAALHQLRPGESFRIKTHLRCLEIRVAQMDPSFQCDNITVSELQMLLDRAFPFLCADAVANALCEALTRQDRRDELKDTIARYFANRREMLKIARHVLKLARDCGLELPVG